MTHSTTSAAAAGKMKAATTRRKLAAAAAAAVPAFEQLEGRRMFVAIAGTAGADVIGISQSGATINVTLNGVTTPYNGPITEVRVDALAGNDRVTTSAGVTIPVKLYGGDGHDQLTGGSGHDVIDGGAGADVLRGQNGNDSIYGMAGDDRCYGGTGNDWIYAGHGNDFADGESGIDRVHGNGQPDVVLEPVYTYSTTTTTRTAFTSLALATATSPTTTTTTTTRVAGTTSSALVLGDISPFYYSDNDVVRGGNDTDYVYGNGGNDAVYGDHGNDQVYGEDGNDRLYAGYGNDRLYAGNGDDVLVTIGGGVYDVAYGMAGLDSFWMDDARTTELAMDGEAAEFAGSNFHWVAAYEPNVIRNNGVSTSQTPSIEQDGQNLADPIAITGYADFRARPLFGAAGPQANDVRQGLADDCYFMAGLSAVAKQNANRIRQSVVDLGDGTYGVQFFKLGKMRYYRVDGDLAATSGVPTYAGLGNGGSTWVAIMEKAFTFFRKFDGGTYDSIGFGLLSEPFDALAMTNYSIWGNNPTETMQMLQHQVVDLKHAVTVRTPAANPPAGLNVVARHAYSVDYVNWTSGYIVLRNPWGQDFYNGIPTDSNPSDGYIVLTTAQFTGYFSGAQWSNV